VNFDIDVSKIRSVMRGEVNGSVRLLLSLMFAAIVWLAARWMASEAVSTASAEALQSERYSSLAALAAEYKARAPSAGARSGAMTASMAFTRVSGRINLGARVGNVTSSSDGKQCTVVLSRLYIEELTDLVSELAELGVKVVEAQITVLPSGGERLLSVTAVLEAGGVS
jgi:hypothetical protein